MTAYQLKALLCWASLLAIFATEHICSILCPYNIYIVRGLHLAVRALCNIGRVKCQSFLKHSSTIGNGH